MEENTLNMCSKQNFIPITLLVNVALILKVVRNLFQTLHLHVDVVVQFLPLVQFFLNQYKIFEPVQNVLSQYKNFEPVQNFLNWFNFFFVFVFASNKIKK